MMLLMVGLASLVLASAPAGGSASEPSPEDCIYPGDEVLQFLARQDDPVLTAAMTVALDALIGAGGEDILICKAMRIEAPLGGYLFDGLWKRVIDGKRYSTFRIGVGDRPEDGPFVLISRGLDGSGSVIWHPPPGPDYTVPADSMMPMSLLDYEFLLWREDFEMLEEKYPRPVLEAAE